MLLVLFSYFSPLETISKSLWARLHHHFPVLSVFSHVSCQFIFVHIFPVVVDPSPSRPPPASSLPLYDQVHRFLERLSSSLLLIHVCPTKYIVSVSGMLTFGILEPVCIIWFLTWSVLVLLLIHRNILISAT